MSDLNEIHRAVGQIESNVLVLMNSVKELREYQLTMNGKADRAHGRIDEIQPHVEDYKKTKKTAIMGLIGLGGMSGVFGSKVAAIIVQLTGG